jgi:C-terminal processing protease CtpA/Prc
VATGPLGVGLVQRGSQVAVSSVDPGSLAAAQRVKVGSILHAVNGQAVSEMEKDAVVELIRTAERPWRLLLRIVPPLAKQHSLRSS